jgi:translation elongation factor EF-1beta
MLEVKPLDD